MIMSEILSVTCPQGLQLLSHPSSNSKDAIGGRSVSGTDLQYSRTLFIHVFEDSGHVINLLRSD